MVDAEQKVPGQVDGVADLGKSLGAFGALQSSQARSACCSFAVCCTGVAPMAAPLHVSHVNNILTWLILYILFYMYCFGLFALARETETCPRLGIELGQYLWNSRLSNHDICSRDES